MTNEEIHQTLRGVPHMSLDQADRMRRFIVEHDVHTILELGFRHGVSTCYMACALADVGGGEIVTIDRESARSADPNIEELLQAVGQRDHVEVFYEPSSYNWRMMFMLEKDSSPRFDLCYLDGAHNWNTDGFAFHLVDRLLKPGGWIIFDDLNWTYASSPTLKDTDFVRAMPEQERKTAQVRKVYDLLVKPHPSYHNFREELNWGFAQKRRDAPTSAAQIKTEVIVEHRNIGLGHVLRGLFKKVARKIRPDS
jgi:predicted O-methyltransferase YrrM